MLKKSNIEHVSNRQHTSAYVSIRQHSSAYRYQYGQEEQDRARREQGHLCQHTSAYVSIRQHTFKKSNIEHVADNKILNLDF